jgi:hypothetical protein
MVKAKATGMGGDTRFSSGTNSRDVLPPRDEEGEFASSRRRNWARLIARTWLCNPELCSSCRQRLRVVAAISSPAQDQVIEKILRARGERDPPWKRPRKTRGPPPVTSESQQGYRIFIADGLKVPKEGKKMPAVKALHQESQDNSKPAFIMGHSFQMFRKRLQDMGAVSSGIQTAGRLRYREAV